MTDRTMIPARERRRFKAESVLMRVVATAGVVGLGVLLGAILVSADIAGWTVGLVVALVSVGLSALLWSSRQL
jgi:protein-S-isoprenylcysteine O-methyltransferase Ste14